ncbi:melanoma-associated antigen B16-like [Microtus oregoni]|uniref:melanoma-associated antigen B16-like n=1 Tax=Microtus oregoni TaxID=111838 RepID=UPI001BB1334A|nr:melanoma-associated antigen B16-like [Microtus oregoni]
MSKLQKNPECAADQGQTCEKTHSQIAAVCMDVEEPCTSSHLMASSLKGQTSEGTQVSRNVEEPCHSSHSLMASNQNDPADETPSTSGGLQSPCDSLRNSGGDLSNQEQGSPVNPPCQPATMNVPVMNVNSKVNFLVNYMLYKYQMKEMMSKTDILRLIVKEDENSFHEILMRSAELMEIVFGIGVKEVDPVNHVYALFIKLGLTYDGMRSDEFSFPKTGLLIIILGVVFLKGNRATEEDIWEALNPMGIYAGVNNFIFGEPRQLITNEFVKEQYLVYQPVADSDPVWYEFVWGPRARAETSKMKVLEFMAKVYGTHPATFQSQYQEALIEEEERALALILDSAGLSSRSRASSSGMGCSFPRM